MRRVKVWMLSLSKAMIFPFVAATYDVIWQGGCRKTSFFWQFDRRQIFNPLKLI